MLHEHSQGYMDSHALNVYKAQWTVIMLQCFIMFHGQSQGCMES